MSLLYYDDDKRVYIDMHCYVICDMVNVMSFVCNILGIGHDE